MLFYKKMEERAKKLSLFDIQMVKTYGFIWGIIIVAIFPQILKVNIWWFVALAILTGIKPSYVFFFKKD